ncbi:NAD(P)/FAD-dependent oxidoreductase [Neorhizobium petrolearium]|uniref:NAD(P)/FAD-dependent oxidoreductase n=1 Tax=Neorhizobium petrolearium TaxID=515361 RepID=UPI003F160A2D
MTGVVVIGAGQGGFQLAASLRQEGYEGPVTLIGDEPGRPYQRPPLSKAYLKDGRVDAIELRPESFFDRNAITLMASERVIRIDRNAKAIETLGGIAIAYDHLVLATGARNFVPPIRGLDGRGAFGLRTAEDACRLRDALARGSRRPIVIGGGFIGLEFAAVAAAGGHKATVVEAAERLMARALSPAMSQHFLDYHTKSGTRLVRGAAVTEVLRDQAGDVVGARLADGGVIDGDMVLVAAGIRPNVELAEQAGLTVANGIVVDGFMRTSDPDISALGDCAAFPDPSSGRSIRLESVQAATDHARTIARRLTGKPHAYEAVPWFWSDQGPLKLQIAGLGVGAEEDHAIEKEDGRKLVFRFKLGKLLALETINAAAEHMAARQLLKSPAKVKFDELAQCGFDIGGLAKARKVQT